MILMTVGDHNSPYLILIFKKIGYVRYDKIDPQHFILRECKSTVKYNNVISITDNGHVLADFTEPPQWNDGEFILFFQKNYLQYLSLY